MTKIGVSFWLFSEEITNNWLVLIPLPYYLQLDVVSEIRNRKTMYS